MFNVALTKYQPLKKFNPWNTVVDAAYKIYNGTHVGQPPASSLASTMVVTASLTELDARRKRHINLMKKIKSREGKQKYEAILLNIEMASFMLSFYCDVGHFSTTYLPVRPDVCVFRRTCPTLRTARSSGTA
jgi:hypothetical protein